jgi:hypothetical protein
VYKKLLSEKQVEDSDSEKEDVSDETRESSEPPLSSEAVNVPVVLRLLDAPVLVVVVELGVVEVSVSTVVVVLVDAVLM